MYYLSIETSCDETSLCLLKKNNPDLVTGESFVKFINNFEIVSSIVSSQIDIHKEFGGVVPEIGAREHAEHIHTLFLLLLKKSELEAQNFDLVDLKSEKQPEIRIEIDNYGEILSQVVDIFVTVEPGLTSALKVGLEFAKSIKFFLKTKYGTEPSLTLVNHLHGHVTSCFYGDYITKPDDEVFPHLHLLVSGGNSQILLLKSPNEFEIVGATLDDAAGECFDKTGRLLGLDYPAGVWLSKIAGLENENIHDLPRGMLRDSSHNYSFSGLKTAVQYYLKSKGFVLEQKLHKENLEYLIATNRVKITDERLLLVKEMCISIQAVIVEQLTRKFKTTVAGYSPKSTGVSGGVSANGLLRQELGKISANYYQAPIFLTGDNAIMIGLRGLTSKYFIK
jgi:N6-L-threonylcarbamoyladenine synthase